MSFCPCCPDGRVLFVRLLIGGCATVLCRPLVKEIKAGSLAATQPQLGQLPTRLACSAVRCVTTIQIAAAFVG